MSELLERVLEHEGFRAKPYQDTEGVWTIGHGLTWINESESRAIVTSRLHNLSDRLIRLHPWLRDRAAVLDVVVEMAFQMGLAGVQKFHNMWAALFFEDYSRAAFEMLDSKWAKQTPSRAEALANIIRGLSDA